jgi:MoxR-like ATPase
MPRIRILNGDRKGEVVQLEGDRVVFGRDADCGVRLDSRDVSRHHACIYFAADRWRVQDLNSANGTLRNGQRVQDTPLHAGDTVALGDVEVRFEEDASPAPAPPSTAADGALRERVATMSERVAAVKREMGRVIVGQEEIVLQLLSAIVSNGHVLMIGMPGLAKTLMIRTLAEALDLEFRRIQFTPDLMPSDITGTDILEVAEDTGRKEYRFIHGPVFTNILLADEINRTPPKTQAALLEAMQEQRVTASGQAYPLAPPFFVLATQNPLEMEGTYPLPEAQLDRFMFSLYVDYPSEAEEERIARATTANERPEVRKVLGAREILDVQEVVRAMPVADHVVRYATRLARATRPGDARAPDFVKRWVHCGAGPRGTQYLVLGAKARAVLAGRLLVSCDDVRAVAPIVLRHRMFTNFNADSEGVDTREIIQRLLKVVEEPGEKEY